MKDFEELKTAFYSLGYQIPDDRLRAMFDDVDTDGSGEADFEEFKTMMRRYG